MSVFFSIIIPSYNSENTIARSIESILEQTFTNFEILDIDGLSGDATIEIAKSYQDERIKISSQKDKGFYDAMNKGIDNAKGEWLYFLGSDDELYSNMVLEEIAAIASEKENNIIYGNVKIIGDTSWAKNGDIYDGVFDLQKLFKKNICHQAIFYRKDFVKKNIGYYNLDYRLCSDWDFNLRCFSKSKFSYTDKIIANFFGGGASTNSNIDNNFNNDFLKNILSYFNFSVFDSMLNDKDFPVYHEVLAVQKKNNYLRYLINKAKKKFF